MTVNIIGDVQPVLRVRTGLYSFDAAFANQKGEIGFPVGKGVEIYGKNHEGKSTITYGLAGLVAGVTGGSIALADFEGFDPDFLTTVLENSGFSGSLYYITKDNDEDALDELLNKLRGDCSVGILDSIGAISPISEQEGDLGEANMGRRAFLIAQFTRKAMKILRENTRTVFMINHAYPKIGGRGLDTPGGEVKKYLASIRISVKRRFLKGKYEEFSDGSYIIEGTVVKNRWGFKDRTFRLFVLSGSGIHVGMTAMFDAVDNGLVARGRVLKLDGKSYGTVKEVIAEAHAGNTEFFAPFIELMNSNKLDLSTPDETEEFSEAVEPTEVEENEEE